VLMLSCIHCLHGELGSLASLQQEPHEFARLLPLRIRRGSSTALPSSFLTWPTGLCLSLRKRRGSILPVLFTLFFFRER
jgi:hypothetical protein